MSHVVTAQWYPLTHKEAQFKSRHYILSMDCIKKMEISRARITNIICRKMDLKSS